jgi:ADP-ribose pyrophosphatase
LRRKLAFRGSRASLSVLDILTRSGQRVKRELLIHPGAVVMIPVLPGGRLVLIRQLRIATGRWIWEFPAGCVEKGESTKRCADRELQEEIGWRPGRLRKILEFFPTPGISTEKMYLYLADRLQKVGPVARDLDEELRARIFSAAQVERMIRRGLIIDGKTILGFLFYRKYFRS